MIYDINLKTLGVFYLTLYNMQLVYLLQTSNYRRYMSQIIERCGCECYKEPTLACISYFIFALPSYTFKLFNIKMNCPTSLSQVLLQELFSSTLFFSECTFPVWQIIAITSARSILKRGKFTFSQTKNCT